MEPTAEHPVPHRLNPELHHQFPLPLVLTSQKSNPQSQDLSPSYRLPRPPASSVVTSLPQTPTRPSFLAKPFPPLTG